MLGRNILLAVGLLFVLAGAVIGILWLREGPASAEKTQQVAPRVEVLSAKRAIASGTLLQPEDIGWKEIEPNQLHPGNLVRGEISEAEFFGAVTTSDFAEGAALVASDLVKLSNRRFLAAVLKPGNRAVSISVNASQSSSGLILPGNYVDIILTQSFSDTANNSTQQTVAETVLHNIRIIAVDQSLGQQPKTDVVGLIAPGAEPRLPRTLTLEVTEHQAEIVSVAGKLGELQLSLRPLENATGPASVVERRPRSTWQYDVSPALYESARLAREAEARKFALEVSRQSPAAPAKPAQAQRETAPEKQTVQVCKEGQRPPCGTGSTLESLVRWPPRSVIYSYNSTAAPEKPVIKK